MGRKCSVEGCLSDTNRPEDVGVTFHKVPLHPDVRPKWISLCRIPEDKKFVKVIYICSRHFLRADFCNFKGKKYMLKQGVLPSVFPWDKSKLEAIKAEANIKKEQSSETSNVNIKKEETKGNKKDIKTEPECDVKVEPMESGNETVQETLKEEPKEKFDEFEKSKLAQSSTGFMNFAINSRIEALDFNSEWYPARIVEVDYEENEVLIHFEKFSSKYDEWICMNSSRLRPLQSLSEKNIPVEQYTVGERCLAAWSGARKFPATVTKAMEHDTYEVLFDDGFVKTLKAHRMSKAHGKVLQSAPLFDPIKSSKQDRRDKKRKLNVASLFKKRPRVEHAEDKAKKQAAAAPATPDSLNASTSTGESYEKWTPHWYKGKPIGTDSTIETSDGQKNSVIVADPRLPSGWHKHLVKKTQGTAAGKWEAIIVSPDNRKFRSKSDIKNYIEQNPNMELNEQMFDFALMGRRQRRSGGSAVKKTTEVEQQETIVAQEPAEPPELPPIDEANLNSLKILFEDDAYKCPIEGCGKNFRRENLAQMHVKHYHPEYTKFLDSTPNVADLAYARTVGENLDKSPGPSKPPPLKPAVRTSTSKTPKLPQSPLPEAQSSKPESPSLAKARDTEIIKLLSSKPFEKQDADTAPASSSSSATPANIYPDIKLKDMLSKSEGIPKRDDLNMKTLSAARPVPGIKTLLPVIRPPLPEPDAETTTKHHAKRKRGISENVEIIKGKETQQSTVTSPSSSSQSSLPAPPQLSYTTPLETPSQQQQQQPPPPPNDIIIEGGEVIKIVRMRQEEIINCTCGFTEEDGLMIQCELCLCWQHAYCNNIERESQVPEKYICYICQHPLRERTSRKYYHDQDWLKHGTLPMGSYHTKDEDALQKRFEKLKKCHDHSGALLELREYMHSLSIKMKIVEAKNHPKLYLWSKPWKKQSLPEKVKLEQEDIKPKIEGDDHQYIKNELDLDKQEPQNDSMLMMILKAGKEVIPKLDLNSLMDNNMGQLSAPIIPQPEAAIDSADCRLNLLEHIAHQESLVEERLDDFEKQIEALEEGMNMETDPNYSKTRQTLQMLVRDLGTLKEFSQSTTL